MQPGIFKNRGSACGKYAYTDDNASFIKHDDNASFIKPCNANWGS